MSKSFLQTKYWAEFQQSLGRKIFWIDNHLIIKFDLPIGKSYLYSPRIKINLKNLKNFKKLISKIQKISQKENAIFFRFDPDERWSEQQTQNFKKYLNLSTCRPVQPQDTLVLDLSQSEKKLSANMKPKTRYNIRLAEKHSIKVRESNNLADVDIFWTLAQETAKRDRFSYHPKIYYRKMLENLRGKELEAQLLIAEHQGEPAAAIIVLFHKESAIYLHGASSYRHRALMAPYLLQWTAIKIAKKRKCKFYDFWGIAPEGDESRHWAGITRFKKGFGGIELHYPGCFELPIQKGWYRIYRYLKNKI